MAKKAFQLTYNENVTRAISYASVVAGEEYSSGNPDSRIYCWYNFKKSESDGYWLTIIVCDENKPNFLINEEHATEKQVYSIIGFCAYHGFRYELEMWIEEFEKEAQQ